MKNQTPTKRWGYLVFPSLSCWGVRTLWVLMSGGELKIVSFQNCHEIASWTKMEFLTLCQSFGEQQKPNLLTWTSSSQQILWVDDNAIFWVISSAQSKSFPEMIYFCLKGETLHILTGLWCHPFIVFWFILLKSYDSHSKPKCFLKSRCTVIKP